MWKKIKNWLSRRLTTKSLKIKNWDCLGYKAMVYTITKTKEGKWAGNASIFLEAHGEAKKDRAFILPLEFVFDNPETIFTILQLLGPIFYNTSPLVAVLDEIGKTVHVWNLTKTTKEQDIKFDQDSFMNLIKSKSMQLYVEDEEEGEDETGMQPTNPGTNSIN